ncbi:MAG: YicC/YloC family endoribonuclease, partial [Pseudomonadota bacterium]
MGDDLPSGASKPAHIQSMTGFGTADGEMSGLSWRWELRSVNGKGLDIKFRIPSGIEGLETDLRKKIRALHRGSILVSLRIERPSGEETFEVNEEALAALAASFSKIRQYIDCDKPRPEAILTLRGVLSSQTSERELPPEARDAILDSFEEALARLISAREEEGRRVAEILQQRLATLADKVMAISGQTTSIRDELAARLKAQLPTLLAEHVTEERLAQEAALLAIKADVSEEVDRLNVHTK